MKTSEIKKQTSKFVEAIIEQAHLKERLIELTLEVQAKMDAGIAPPFRLELEFEVLSDQLNNSVQKQLKAEIALGINKSKNFILN